MATGADSDDEPGETGDLFADPEDYYPPSPPPTSQTYTTQSGATVTLHLVGHSPLEAHHLWNGSRVVAQHFEAHPDEVRGRTLLELGAGAGLPSIVAAILGSARVVVTDFPDPDLVQTMWKNVRGCELIPRAGDGEDLPIVVDGYVWGADVKPLLAHLPPPAGPGSSQGFDVLVLADLLFRHSEHGRMLSSIAGALSKKRSSKAFVVFTSYRPWLAHKDLAFFDLAREQGFEVEQIFERKMDRPLFENDPGDEEVRKTVLGFTVRWPREACLEDQEG
ncbi:hypothetical protein GQ53DRAFT_661553 [Thozetella sp. PMI_491]|nr:hypothetical protein GQ53DRAFT_661553 [Thozetella sp. PMI_491]